MNGYGLDFWSLERIQSETGLSNGEMKQRNLHLSKVEKEILAAVPLDGPLKCAKQKKAARLYYEFKRAVPASLILAWMGRVNNFDDWMEKIREGADTFQSLNTHFLSLEV